MSETTTQKTSGSLNIVNLEKFRDTVLFSVGIRRWNNRAQVKDMTSLQAYLEQLEAEKRADAGETSGEAKAAVLLASDRVKSSKVLIKSKAYDELCRAMNDIKAWTMARSMPSYFRAGMFVVKSNQVGAVETELRKRVTTLEGPEGPLEKFLAGYEADVERSRTAPVKQGGLGPLFRQTDYPVVDELRKCFSLEWFWLALGVPENIPDSLREEAGEKFKRRLSDAADEIENALRSEFVSLLEHAEERLTTPPGEKPRVFRDSMIGNLIEFVNLFDSKDVFSDKRLADIVNKTKAVLLDDKGDSKIAPSKLREYASVRDAAKQTFANLKNEVAALIEEKPGRLFDFSE